MDIEGLNVVDEVKIGMMLAASDRESVLSRARKMEESGHSPDKVITVSAYPETVDAGPFTVSFLPISHSIPESSGLVIDSAAGRVVHTGDFKLDETPVLGEPFDEALWREVSKDGVKALVCDSTNVFSPNAGRSEASVKPEITKLIAASSGMVVATTFASNVARLKTLAEAGQAVELALEAGPFGHEQGWTWRVAVGETAGEANSLAGLGLQADELVRWDPDRVPELEPELAADRFVLTAVDGVKTLAEIADALCERFPERFTGVEEAQRRVLTTLQRKQGSDAGPGAGSKP